MPNRPAFSPPGGPGFAAVLRDHTASVHRAAERTGFVADILRSRATIAGYASFLRNLVPVYAALERALARYADHPVAGAFANPGLRRLPLLEEDLRALPGTEGATLPVSNAASAYAARIEEGASNPYHLVAHGYARYLGDLSGGQILKPLLARTLHIGDDALRFYDFPALDDLARTKAALREALDRVPEASASSVCGEAVRAFDLNIALSIAVQTAY